MESYVYNDDRQQWASSFSRGIISDLETNWIHIEQTMFLDSAWVQFNAVKLLECNIKSVSLYEGD